MPEISRRAALARGGRALTVAAILPPLASVSVEADAAGDDAELVETWRRYSALMAEHEAALIAADRAGKTGVGDEKADASFAQASELRERILVTQARTPAGIAVKLKIAAEVDSMHAKEYPGLVVPRAVLSALADLERMAGGAA